MTYRLIVKPLAEQDITQSYLWYNEQREGLGEEFLNELERSIQQIIANPHQYQIRYKEIRMAKIRRFPFCLHYLTSGETIFVLAVLNTSRDPRIWRKRK